MRPCSGAAEAGWTGAAWPITSSSSVRNPWIIRPWPRNATVTAFQVRRSAAPYFDAGVVGGVGSYFYVVRVFKGVGLYSDSGEVGAFTFAVTRGGP